MSPFNTAERLSSIFQIYLKRASQEHIYALKGHLFRIFALFYLPGKDDFLKCWVEEPRRKART